MKKRKAKRGEPVVLALSKIEKSIAAATTEVLHLHAQITGVKLDIEALQNKVLGVSAVMSAQLSAALASWTDRLDALAKKKRR